MSKKTIQKNTLRIRRKTRIRSKVEGTAERPRLSVFRSAKHISAQLIDDIKGVTLAAASDVALKDAKAKPLEKAAAVGTLLVKNAKDKNISRAVFDRSGYKYHGRVKALADAAREGGLEF